MLQCVMIHSTKPVMALFGSLSTLRFQLGNTPQLATTFQYLEELLRPQSPAHERLLRVPEGDSIRIELDAGAFAMEQAYQTRPANAVKWESHRAYVDIQVVVCGQELMEVADIASLQVAEDHTPGKDVLFYHPSPRASLLKISSGAGAVFFPVDAHRPSMAIEMPVLVRKSVVKVPVAWWKMQA